MRDLTLPIWFSLYWHSPFGLLQHAATWKDSVFLHVQSIAMKSLLSNALHGYSFTLFAEYFWFQYRLHKKHHTSHLLLYSGLYAVQKYTRFSVRLCWGRATKWPHKYAHRKHTHKNIHTHTQNICNQHPTVLHSSRPVKIAISHRVVNMKNKHTRKSLPPVNYLSPDCIWPFTLLSVANYNPSLRTRCNLGIGMSRATSSIQIKQRKTCLRSLLVISLISQTGELFAIWVCADNQWILWQWAFHSHVFTKCGCCAL